MSTLLTNDRWQERAAILTHDAGFPEPIAQAAAVIFCITPPEAIDVSAWRQVIEHTGARAG